MRDIKAVCRTVEDNVIKVSIARNRVPLSELEVRGFCRRAQSDQNKNEFDSRQCAHPPPAFYAEGFDLLVEGTSNALKVLEVGERKDCVDITILSCDESRFRSYNGEHLGWP
jgi:hypothetical protein